MAVAAIHCPPPLPPRHGRLLLPRHHRHPQSSEEEQEAKLLVGETVQYACKEGFVLIGEPVIRCTEQGLWSHSVPFCESLFAVDEVDYRGCVLGNQCHAT